MTYDANGNLTNDGTSSYTWDRANRLLSMGGHAYAYDGDGRRISQTVSSVVTKYLLDTQPGLSVVLSQTTGSDTTHYIHTQRGIHAVQQPAGDWQYPVTDGLGSVRGYVDPVGTVLSSVHYTEVGVPSVAWDGWAFTGEPRDANGLQYHRARYYAPGLAVWTALDPWEGLHERPMSLNGYSWVEGRVVNATDASGRIGELPSFYAPCVFLGALPLLLNQGQPLSCTGTVTGRSANIRFFPDTSTDDTIITTVPQGTVLTIVGSSWSANQTHRWFGVRTTGLPFFNGDSGVGYIREDLIRLDESCRELNFIGCGRIGGYLNPEILNALRIVERHDFRLHPSLPSPRELVNSAENNRVQFCQQNITFEVFGAAYFSSTSSILFRPGISIDAGLLAHELFHVYWDKECGLQPASVMEEVIAAQIQWRLIGHTNTNLLSINPFSISDIMSVSDDPALYYGSGDYAEYIGGLPLFPIGYPSCGLPELEA